MQKVFILVITIALLTSCSSADKKEKATKDNYEKAKETLLQTETKSPTKFLTINIKDKKNLIGQTVIKGTVSSTAKEATFKDVELELSFYSKTGVMLEKDNETIYEEIKAGKDADFKSKYFAPKGTDSVAAKIVSAKVSN